MPITWNVAGCGVAISTEVLEAYGVSVATELGELSEVVSTGVEFPIADSAYGVSVAVELGELSEAVWIGGELLVADSAVAGVGDAATDGVFS